MNALSDLKWLIGMLLLLFVAWIFFGSRSGIGGPFIKHPAPIESGGTYGDSINQGGTGTIDEEIENIQTDIKDLNSEVKKIEGSTNSRYKGLVEISSYSGAKQSSVSKERIELKVSRKAQGKIAISGWKLESGVTGSTDAIENGSYLPYSGRVNSQQSIFVEAGDKIIISTGRSPIGTSFRINQCTGYFEQFQDFEPSLPRSCPKPVDDLPNMGAGDLAEICLDFVESMPRCEVYLEEIPQNIGGACQNYVTSKVNYNTCVTNHKEDFDFYKNEWRVFLERDQELWKSKREIIKLIDETGQVVDVVTY